jgi:hypothetical protein
MMLDASEVKINSFFFHMDDRYVLKQQKQFPVILN